MRHMSTGKVGTVVICIHSSKPPSDAEWAEYVAELKTYQDLSVVRNIVFTEGGAPNSAQRKEVNDLLKGRPGLAAVVSDSTVVRGVVTALNWFNSQIKAFATDGTDQAYRHLKCNAEEIVQVTAEVVRLKKRLGAALQQDVAR